MSEPNPIEMIARLQTQLAPPSLWALLTVRRLTDESSVNLYLVGGAVRDLALERPTVDLDLAVETDVAVFAHKLAAEIRGRVVLHERFGTSTISGRGWQVDLARTRRESYEHPGALPTVEPASLQDDLARRDFTINAMALRLAEDAELIDPHGGMEDIAQRQVRVLHERSFEDDATRMLRAVRYAARLGFNIEQATVEWLQRDLPFIAEISGPRLRRELVLICQETSGARAAAYGEALGLLRAVHAALHLSDDARDRWELAWQDEVLAQRDETGFCILAGYADDDALTSLSARLHLTGRFEDALRDAVRLRNESSKLAAMRHDPVAAVETLQHAAPSAVWATGIVAGGDVAGTCESYLREWRHVKPLLRGDDVIALGVQRGVAVGDTLRALRNARLTGATTTREDEETLVRALLQKTAP